MLPAGGLAVAIAAVCPLAGNSIQSGALGFFGPATVVGVGAFALYAAHMIGSGRNKFLRDESVFTLIPVNPQRRDLSQCLTAVQILECQLAQDTIVAESSAKKSLEQKFALDLGANRIICLNNNRK